MQNIPTTILHLLICLSILFPMGTGCNNNSHETASIEEPPALLIAAEQGDLPTLTKLIGDKGVTIDVKDACFWTPLMKAALNGHTEAAERLILAGADVNQADKGGYTSLMLAASNNHVDVIDLLINAGAEINHVEQTQGWTALIWAAKRGHKEAVERLLAHPIDREVTDYNGKRALDWANERQFTEIASLLTKAG
jgi:ankyrin repeat protein